jgi:hypothetical protein
LLSAGPDEYPQRWRLDKSNEHLNGDKDGMGSAGSGAEDGNDLLRGGWLDEAMWLVNELRALNRELCAPEESLNRSLRSTGAVDCDWGSVADEEATPALLQFTPEDPKGHVVYHYQGRAWKPEPAVELTHRRGKSPCGRCLCFVKAVALQFVKLGSGRESA